MAMTYVNRRMSHVDELVCCIDLEEIEGKPCCRDKPCAAKWPTLALELERRKSSGASIVEEA